MSTPWGSPSHPPQTENSPGRAHITSAHSPIHPSIHHLLCSWVLRAEYSALNQRFLPSWGFQSGQGKKSESNDYSNLLSTRKKRERERACTWGPDLVRTGVGEVCEGRLSRESAVGSVLSLSPPPPSHPLPQLSPAGQASLYPHWFWSRA